jgi:predicted aconitase with swiveling domain
MVAGEASGEVLRLDEPLSFWGGLDPTTGRIIDRRHPQVGESVADRVLVMPSGRVPVAAAASCVKRSGPEPARGPY